MSAQMPGAWYDLTVRIHEAQAVASCVLESLPHVSGVEYERMNHTGLLISALEDILKLASADADMVAAHMKL